MGSFVLGLVVSFIQVSVVAPELRALLTVGFLGAFTTFSTFAYEAVLLVQGGEWGRAVAYLGGSVVAGLVAVVAGIWLGGLMLPARA